MSYATHYEVRIEETIIETRTVRIPKSEVNTAQDAANMAYRAWVLQGRCEEATTSDVHGRTYEIDGEFYYIDPAIA